MVQRSGAGFRAKGSAGLTALATAALVLAGCAGSRVPVSAAPLPAVDGVGRLGVGDKVRISVFGETALSGEFQVAGNGMLTLPLIGDTRAIGLSARELEALIVQRYSAGYLNAPKVVVEIYDLRPFSILGEVSRPGQYPSRGGMTVLDAVAAAGGFTYRANQSGIFVRRSGEQVEHRVDMQQNPLVAPGDIIRIGERYF